MLTIHRAKLGDVVQVRYVGLRVDGTAAGTHHGPQVLEFAVGSDTVISGISLGVVGMAAGEKKRLTLPPDDAYGDVRRKLIREIPRGRFPPSLDLHVGKGLTLVGKTSGRRQRVRVVELKSGMVVVDGNHPRAGKVTAVEIQLVSLESPSGDVVGPQNVMALRNEKLHRGQLTAGME